VDKRKGSGRVQGRGVRRVGKVSQGCWGGQSRGEGGQSGGEEGVGRGEGGVVEGEGGGAKSGKGNKGLGAEGRQSGGVGTGGDVEERKWSRG